MKSLALTLFSITSVFAATAQAQPVQISGGAIAQPGTLNIGTSLTLNGGGNISISSGGNFSAPVVASGTVSLQGPSRGGALPIKPGGGNVFLVNPGGVIGTAPRGTISVMPSTPAITSRGTITVASAPPSQTASLATLQSAVPMATPVAPAGNLVNGAVTVRMPLVNASAITLR